MDLLDKRAVRLAVIGAILSAAQAGVPAQAAQLAFVTSVEGNGVFGTWPGAGGQVGLAAADAICVARATAGRLPNPGDFVAWASDANNDAYCRVHGFSGKKTALCGQAVIPTGAGPWQRVDGAPFMTALSQTAAASDLFASLNVDESGALINDEILLTGTNADGTADTRHCSNWQGTAADAGAGRTSETYPGWTAGSSAACATSTGHHLACMHKGSGPPFGLPIASGRKQAFITSLQFWANFMMVPQSSGLIGMDGADAICRNLAQAANLYQPQSFRAFLADGANPAGRFQNDGPWARIDGAPFADNFAQIASGYVRSPLNVTETGTYVDMSSRTVWTGFNTGGQPGSLHCAGWTATMSITGTIARPNATGPYWPATAPGVRSCTVSNSLYCLADYDGLFRYGF